MCRLTRCIIKVYALCGVYQTDNLMYDYPVDDDKKTIEISLTNVFPTSI